MYPKTFRCHIHVPQQNVSVISVCSYLRVKLRQLLFIEVSLGVDTSFVTELKHKNRQSADFVSCPSHLSIGSSFCSVCGDFFILSFTKLQKKAAQNSRSFPSKAPGQKLSMMGLDEIHTTCEHYCSKSICRCLRGSANAS